MKNWIEAIAKLKQDHQAFVLVTVIGVQGSTPRESGAKMVITATTIYDTIGGGHLEYKVMETAKKMLTKNANEAQQVLEHFPLSASLGQCCGGSVSVLFELFPAINNHIMLFGAGHVGKALVTILSGLPCKIEWVDNRHEEFPPTNDKDISKRISEHPIDEIDDMPAGSFFIIMTHNHQLDLELCEAVLKRDDFAYLGIIGSQSKAIRFRKKLERKQYSSGLIKKIRCPIGLNNVPGKKPMEVAVSIAGELIGLMQQQNNQKSLGNGINWRDVKQLMAYRH